MTKLATSAAGSIGLAVGFADLVGQYRDRIKAFGATSFERAVSALPHELRAARAAKIKHARDYDYAYNAKAAYALLGCAAGRVRAVVFYEHRDFAPVETDAWLSPYVDAEPESAGAVLLAAQRQLQYVRREYGPDARRRALRSGRNRPHHARPVAARRRTLDRVRRFYGAHGPSSPRDRAATVFPVKARAAKASQLSCGALAATGETIAWLRSPRVIAPRWKCGSSLTLPIADADEPWDSASAALSIFAASGLSSSPWGDGSFCRRGFLVYDAANVTLKSSYKFAFAAIIDGVLTVVPAGLAEARRALEACSLPNDVKMKAQRVLDFYCEKAAMIALADRE